MMNQFCQAIPEELPADYAARLGQHYNKSISKAHKKKNGQFFTPVKMARLMAEMVSIKSKKLRILDPGCGVGILGCALIEHLIKEGNVESIDLIVYETDNNLIFYTEASLDYLKSWIKIKFEYSIHTQDFIIDNNFSYQNFDKSYFHQKNLFDIVISNPPYFKLSAKDKRVLIGERILGRQPNIYSIFMSVAATLLKSGGELIFVIPRSFTSGYYYTSFRNFFLRKLRLDNIHIFTSRRYPFQIDNVLQETVIMKASRIEAFNPNKTVRINSSIGLHDISDSLKTTIPLNRIIQFNSSQKIIHLPTSEQEENIIAVFDSWNKTLKDYKISVSTGPVVDFRSLEFLSQKPRQASVPLIWLTNVCKMKLNWPLLNDKNNKSRPQYIDKTKLSLSRLINNQNCILIRRFSSKDDLSRLIATPFFKEDFSQFTHLGIENHLNYIYKSEDAFNISEIYGISVLLNSYLFDIYFRTFNGNTNVSATELRNIPMPPYQLILKIGDEFINSERKDQFAIDSIINTTFNFPNSNT